MTILLIVLHLAVSITLIAVVLLQSGKGAEMGATFGAGGSQSVFGAGGGSIASVNDMGLLKVGPRSAGADPGPVAYGKGGGGGAEVAAVPIQSGQLTLTVTVSMTYQLK